MPARVTVSKNSQIWSKSVKRLRKYCDLTIFQHVSRRHLEFSKIQILNGWYAWETTSASFCQISSRSVDPLLRYGDFYIFQMAAVCYLKFLKVYFKGSVPYGPQWTYASLCQIWSKSVKRLQRYCDLTVFLNGGRSHHGFSKIQIPNRLCTLKTNPRHPCKFYQDRSIRCGDMAIFQNGGRRHLGFSEIQILTGWYAWETQSV